MKVELLETPVASDDIKSLRGRVLERYRDRTDAIERDGCKSAGYRLSGAEVASVCCCHLYADWRMLTTFPDDETCVIVRVARHTGGGTDVYAFLYELLSLDPPAEERRKPSCCDEDGQPPVDEALVDEVVARMRQLGRRR